MSTFDDAYGKAELTFGELPSEELMAFLRRSNGEGLALDLGAGLGRDTIAMAELGFDVVAVDGSSTAMSRLASLGMQRGLKEKIKTITADVREFEFPVDHFDVISAVTILDHLERDEIHALVPKMIAALKVGGAMFVEVHSKDDPGSSNSEEPASEFSNEIQHYFSPNELFNLFEKHLRILRYEDKLEWDDTHGPIHKHGFALLLGVHKDAKISYFGI